MSHNLGLAVPGGTCEGEQGRSRRKECCSCLPDDGRHKRHSGLLSTSRPPLLSRATGDPADTVHVHRQAADARFQ
ncbi:hypothetical protein ANTPLA_LOCUS3420 [Anthophora plagiata]